MARKRRKVPKVLWRLFGERARTLSDTIASIVPGDLSFLRRPDDRPHYRRLLNQAYVVVNPDAPPLTEFSRVSWWTQRQIVTRIIEMKIARGSPSSNVLCSSYDKWNCASPIVDLLTTSAWSCLLERVGDCIMVYLLEHTSLFLPLPRRKHHQVAGPPISSLIYKLPKYVAEPKDRNPSLPCSGQHKKRDRVGEQQLNSSSFACTMNSFSCFGCCGSYYTSLSVEQPSTEYFKSFSEAAQTTAEGNAKNNEEHPSEDLQELSMTPVNSRKRSRPFKWQRDEKRGLLGAKHGTNRDMGHYKCTCCSLLYASISVSKGALIPRQNIFYNAREYSSVLPGHHILYCLTPNPPGAESLVRDIFGFSDADVINLSKSCGHSSEFCQRSSSCIYHLLIELSMALIRQARSCNPAELFNRHCRSSSLNEKCASTSSSASKGAKSEIVLEGSSIIQTRKGMESYCSKSQVVSFIWAVCRSIVPPDLLGSPSNWRNLTRNISRFIRLRRYEKFSINQCMLKLKAAKFPFLSDKHSLCCSETWQKGGAMNKPFSSLKDVANQLKQKLLRKWIFWFFSRLIVPLLQANFYVTESETGKQDIYYYPKSTWGKLSSTAISNMLDQNYKPLDVTDVKNIIGKRLFGLSKLRLRPKENGIRILANLKAPSRMPDQAVVSQVSSNRHRKRKEVGRMPYRGKLLKSVNNVLRDAHIILKGILQKEPQKLGASVFDYNDVYRKLCPFIISLRSGSTVIPEVFIVVADVSKAFDSVDQDKLLDVLNDVVKKDCYVLERSHQVVCLKNYVWPREKLVLSNAEDATTCRRSGATLFGSLHTVLVEQGLSRSVRKEDLLFNLKEHVKKNVLQFDKKFYLQGVGIAQGSIVSTLLCSLYYGHLENNVIFPYLVRASKPARPFPTDNTHSASSVEDNTNRSTPPPSYMVLRFTDDFLFISTSESQAASFLTRLRRGFQLYNCYMNVSKFSFNFDIGEASGLPSNRVYVGEGGSFLRWSGLLLNSRTLEVQADYTRYLKNHLSSSLTVCSHSKPGRQLKMKLYGFMRPKCHPMFYDSNINSAHVVRLNVYQAFLLAAMKFHCSHSEICSICLLPARFYVKLIRSSVRYMHLLIKKRMRFVFPGSDLRPRLQLDGEEIEWLGLYAYVQVLKKKQSRHKQLLSLLSSELSAHRITKDVPAQLEYATLSSHSSVLWKIKY